MTTQMTTKDLTEKFLEGKKALSVSDTLKAVTMPVKLGNLFTASGRKVPGKLVIENSKTRDVYGIVSPDYKLIKHEDALEQPLNVLSKSGFVVKNVAFMRNDSHVIVDLMSKELVSIDGDKFAFRMFMRNSYDGHSAFKIEIGMFRLKCLNGMGIWALGGKYKFEATKWHIGTDDKFEKFYKEVAANALSIKTVVPKYAQMFADLKKIPVKNTETAAKILKDMNIGDRTAESIIENWQEKVNYSPDAYGLLNGITGHYSRVAENSKADSSSLLMNDKTRMTLKHLLALPTIKPKMSSLALN